MANYRPVAQLRTADQFRQNVEEIGVELGLGRMILRYPVIVADILGGKPLLRRRICRTFSDCITGPRNHLPSGCYPLDDFYIDRLEAGTLAQAKKEIKQ